MARLHFLFYSSKLTQVSLSLPLSQNQTKEDISEPGIMAHTFSPSTLVQN